MLSRGITLDQVRAAAIKVHAEPENVQHVGRDGLRFVIRPVAWTGKGRKGGNQPYVRKGFSRLSSGERRTTNAICWHGHREFFRELFKLAPEGKVQTASLRGFGKGERWYTAENFERLFGKTDRNVGSMMDPMRFSEACWCHEQGRESGVQFGTLRPDGVLTEVRTITHAAIKACPFYILVPSHYREDGRCKCDDPQERARMIAEWEYTEEDFREKGLI
jgi:hypothetical protein